jgi:hypothetical protein
MLLERRLRVTVDAVRELDDLLSGIFDRGGEPRLDVGMRLGWTDLDEGC